MAPEASSISKHLSDPEPHAQTWLQTQLSIEAGGIERVTDEERQHHATKFWHATTFWYALRVIRCYVAARMLILLIPL